MTTSEILSTKLYIPPTRKELVSRSRLIERLNAGLDRKLTLLSAPAGFGKTTLVSEWIESLNTKDPEGNHVENRVAWLSLDNSDNDSARFLNYFVSALNQAEGMGTACGESLLPMLQTRQPPPAETVLTVLINEIVAFTSKIILVLDDYHLINEPSIDDALTFLLEYLPPQLHLILLTRVDPQLPLARLRTDDQMNEFRAEDLRFSSSEATDFLNGAMGLDLSKEDIAVLETRTEGWIAGLQLAALSIQGSEDQSSLIKSFTGSHRHVLDYLVEEVITKQPENIQNFLLQTAILNRLTGPLCDALTSQENSQENLEALERANLFIVRLDNDRRWYRYHHLFADLLRQRLSQTQPEKVPTLHLLASEWFNQNKFIDEAVDHAFLAEDYEWAAHLIEKYVDVVWGKGEHTKISNWLNKLPTEVVNSKPNLYIFRAMDFVHRFQLDEAEITLQTAEQLIDPTTETGPQDQISNSKTAQLTLKGRAAAVRAIIASYREDVSGIIEYTDLALKYLPEHDTTWRGLTVSVQGDTYFFKGDVAAAYQAQQIALKACKEAGDIYLILNTSANLALLERAQGLLQQCIQRCKQQVHFANESGMSKSNIVGWLLAIWGETLAEMNELDESLKHAKQGVKLTENGGSLQILGWSSFCLIRILFAHGDLAGVEEIIQKIENLSRESKLPTWITNQLGSWQARLWLEQNDLDAATRWAIEHGFDFDGEPDALEEINFFSLFEYIVYARVLFAQGRLDETIAFLQRLREPAEAGGRISRVIEILILQALASQARGDMEQSIAILETALTMAERHGFIRIFVDEGPPMEALLKRIKVEDRNKKQYVRMLLAAFSDKDSHPSALVGQILVEPLSKRELEVLVLIAEGLTNREIADRLYLSLNMVKAHTRNMYGKLAVSNRTQAVAQARALGILNSNG